MYVVGLAQVDGHSQFGTRVVQGGPALALAQTCPARFLWLFAGSHVVGQLDDDERHLGLLEAFAPDAHQLFQFVIACLVGNDDSGRFKFMCLFCQQFHFIIGR